MKQENKHVPSETQMLYILRHWDELHEKFKNLRNKYNQMEKQYGCAQLAIKRLRQQNGELSNNVQSLTMQNKQHQNTIKQLKVSVKLAKRNTPSAYDKFRKWLEKLF